MGCDLRSSILACEAGRYAVTLRVAGDRRSFLQYCTGALSLKNRRYTPIASVVDATAAGCGGRGLVVRELKWVGVIVRVTVIERRSLHVTNKSSGLVLGL
jgi:hypothetical protein